MRFFFIFVGLAYLGCGVNLCPAIQVMVRSVELTGLIWYWIGKFLFCRRERQSDVVKKQIEMQFLKFLNKFMSSDFMTFIASFLSLPFLFSLSWGNPFVLFTFVWNFISISKFCNIGLGLVFDKYKRKKEKILN